MQLLEAETKMIKFYISYFYQIRNMTPNMLPISTAMHDPAWFHLQGHNGMPTYIDHNGVINGMRMSNVCMDEYRVQTLIKKNIMCEQLCTRDHTCCTFMEEYAKCIRAKNPDFNKFIDFCERYVYFLNQSHGLNIDTIIFIVHEPPYVKCGERPVLQEWFKENGYELEEFKNEAIL